MKLFHDRNITSLVGNITSLAGYITSLAGNITSLVGNITNLVGNITSLVGYITSLATRRNVIMNYNKNIILYKYAPCGEYSLY